MVFFLCTRCNKRRSVPNSNARRKYCIPCANLVEAERTARWVANNPERHRSNMRKYWEKNKDKYREYRRVFYRKNRDYCLQKSKAYQFRKDLMARVLLSRDELNKHLRVNHSIEMKVPDLQYCNDCLIKQGKIDCAERLYEENFIVRDTIHGEATAPIACAVNLAAPLKFGAKEYPCKICKRPTWHSEIKNGCCAKCVPEDIRRRRLAWRKKKE